MWWKSLVKSFAYDDIKVAMPWIIRNIVRNTNKLRCKKVNEPRLQDAFTLNGFLQPPAPAEGGGGEPSSGLRPPSPGGRRRTAPAPSPRGRGLG